MDSCFAIDDLVINILGFINDGKTYKNVRLVCHNFYNAAKDRVDEFSNHLWTLIKKFPKEDWNWENIAANPNTRPEFILNMRTGEFKKFIQKQIYKDSRNPYLVESTFRRIFRHLSENPRLTIEVVKNTCFKETNPWDYDSLSQHKNITMQDIRENITMPWSSSCVYSNPNFTCDSIINDRELMNEFATSGNINITEKLILKHPNLNWEWRTLVYHHNISWDFIKKHVPDYQSYSVGISSNINITPQIIEENTQIRWCYPMLSMNLGIPLSYIISHFVSHSETKWDWMSISARKDITLDIILDNPQLPWSWDIGVSRNPNLTWRFVRDNPQIEWNWQLIGSNCFNATATSNWQDIIYGSKS